MRDDGPGHGRSVDLADHPEHAEPAEVLSPLLARQNLRKVGEDDGHRTSDPAEGRGAGGETLTGLAGGLVILVDALFPQSIIWRPMWCHH